MTGSQLPADGENDAMPAQIAPSPETSSLKCCCGSHECVLLRHNNAILDHVERDVHQAARMGQSYMADTERDRGELTTRIEQLERDNKELEAMNAKIIEENKDLLDQLETLNTTVIDSEAQAKSLEATLLSSQQTIRRLEADTARAEALERQIATLEEEQASLQGNLVLSRDEARTAASRWKRAERGISDLQDQLERIEKEAREEQGRHAEMMERIERQREMEKELNTAAGRLKGAAAAKSMNQANGGTHVVGHFVRDLLQDNANLQYGIAELREMLMNSNDEIQALREQLEYHQIAEDREGSATPTLKAELESLQSPVREARSPTRLSQELHIHHHYHVATPKQDARKPKKKRLGLTSGAFAHPASHPSTPPTGLMRHSSAPHSRKNSIRSNRWSTFSGQQSDVALSSAPSSPLSNNRNSLFDAPPTASFPGSPTTSIDPMSPSWHPMQKRGQLAPSFQVPTCFPFGPAPPSIAQSIAEEPSDGTDVPSEPLPSIDDYSVVDGEASSRGLSILYDDSSVAPSETTDSDGPGRPFMRRALSHESIVSLSGGLDIHTLKSRPSQLTMRQLGSACSVTGSSIVTARPLLSRDPAKRSSALLRDSFDLLSPVGSPPSSSSSQQRSDLSRLGKWVPAWRPWGGSSPSGNAADGSSGAGRTVLDTPVKEKDHSKNVSRSPGINQPGAIPGFSEFLASAAKKSPNPAAKTTPDVVDHEALREGLIE
ncbi:hypothetical protein F4808DRAFT_466912 [Astrocystis sublimbata]|nr:hypothetical protein F4808DRAFT_466912 [Astrocystis sublimbata]